MIKRKLSKATAEEMKYLKAKRKFKKIVCSKCQEEYVTVPIDVKAVTCAECVIGFVGGTGIVKKIPPEDKRPRGWHKKPQYTSPSGKKYVRGVEVEKFPDEKSVKSIVKEQKKDKMKPEEPKKKRGRPPKNKK